MKPRTRLQKEIARLSKRLPQISEKQEAYAYRHCFKHYGRRSAKGIIHCTECGHSWKEEHSLADAICGCRCPHCGMELEILNTRKRVFRNNEYYSIITTCKQYQVIRFSSSKPTSRLERKPSITLPRLRNDGLHPTASPRRLPDCAVCPFFIMTCGLNTAIWK